MKSEEEDLSLYDQLLLLALHNRKYPTREYQHRCLARWFSNTLATPYQEALMMTTEELMLHNLEWTTAEYTEKQIDKVFKSQFVNTKIEISKEENREKEDLDWALQQRERAMKEEELRAVEKKAAAAGLTKPKEKAAPPIIEGIEFPPDIKKTF